MAGNVILGSSRLTTGNEFFYPEWYARLYSMMGGDRIDHAYLAGWMLEPDCELIAAPSLDQMSLVGTGADPTVSAVAALNDVPAFSGFTSSRRIRTAFAGGKNFTLIGLVNITADMIAGNGHANRLFSRYSGGQNVDFSMTGAGVLYLQFGLGLVPVTVPSTSLTPGPHIVMATCRETAADTFRVSIFVDDLSAPVSSASGVSFAMLTGGVWDIGSVALDTYWAGDIAGWLIIDGDITADADGYAHLQATLPAALAWMTP